jgi:site-specific DNA-methyltransferase (adenine-specific)
LAEFEPESVDSVLTDPPYGETKLEWDRWQSGWLAAARRVLKRSGSMWVFGSQKMFWNNFPEFAGWRLIQDVVWEKHNGSGFHADRFKRVHEQALHFIRDDALWSDVYRDVQYTNDAVARTIRRRPGRAVAHMGEIGGDEYQSVDGGPRLMRSVIFVRSEHHRAVHPTQKPIGIVEPLLLYSTPPGGTVLDCFGGSGTTAVVAARHGRNSILIEADPEFVEVSKRRISGDLFQLDGALV